MRHLALLADRFTLKVQQAKRNLPVYAPVTARPDARPGPKLRPAEGRCAAAVPAPGCGANVWRGHAAVARAGDGGLAWELAGFVGRLVHDRAGLSGAFEVELEWAPEFADPGDRAWLLTALQEQLGLKLESRVGPVDVLVIESVERPIDH